MASTTKLLKLGVHNTWKEMAEAHKASQLERLKLTTTGRAVLRYLNYSETYIADTDRKARLLPELRESISVAPIPRNMHPPYHKEERQGARHSSDNLEKTPTQDTQTLRDTQTTMLSR